MKLISEIRKGASFIFPVVGEITFDKDGIIEVSDKDGQEILDLEVNDIREVGTKSVKQKGVDKKKDAAESQVNDAVAGIKAMKSYKDLHALCEDAKLPKAKWEDMKIPELKAYLISVIAPEAAPKEEAPVDEDTLKVTDSEGNDVTDEAVSIEEVEEDKED